MHSNFKEAQQFVEHYRNSNEESLSGPGSTIKNTSEARKLIQDSIKSCNINSILDLGCGDWNWFQHIDLQGASYLGWDADTDMIIANQFNYIDEIFVENDVDFDVRDIVLEPYPKSDLIICRDVLFHMPIEMAQHVLNKIKKSCKYLISTCFREVEVNEGIGDKNWGYYPINLNLSPFNLSKHEIQHDREMLGASPDGIILSPKRFICLYDFTSEKNI
jgi:SAM-dependent methyltransferase